MVGAESAEVPQELTVEAMTMDINLEDYGGKVVKDGEYYKLANGVKLVRKGNEFYVADDEEDHGTKVTRTSENIPSGFPTGLEA